MMSGSNIFGKKEFEKTTKFTENKHCLQALQKISSSKEEYAQNTYLVDSLKFLQHFIFKAQYLGF
jgi:hypothetical protein